MARLPGPVLQLLLCIACTLAGWIVRGAVLAPGADANGPNPPASAASAPQTAAGPPSARRLLPPDVFFVFYAPPYLETCGGCTVIHLLVDTLNRRYGSVQAPVAYIVPMTEDDIWKSVPLTTNPGYATPLLPKWLDPADGIAVYTDVVRGNPLRAKRVVRWVLFFPGGISGAPAASEYSADDLIACYTAAYCREFSWRPTVPLAVVDLYLDYYRDLPRPPGGRRNGTLWYSKKLSYTVGGKRLERPEPDLSGKDVLDYSVTKRARLERFATAALFVSYDPATYRSVEAALAGCPSVVVPFPGLDRATYVRDFGRFIGRGVGYGLEEGGRSMETMGGVIDEARESLAKQREDVDGFVAAVLDRWFPGAAGDPEMARFAREADPRAEMQLVRMRARQKEGHAP